MKYSKFLFPLLVTMLLIYSSAYSSVSEANEKKPSILPQAQNVPFYIKLSSDTLKLDETAESIISKKKGGGSQDFWKKILDRYFSPIINLIGIIIATLLVLHRIKKQHKSGLDLQRESFKHKTNLDVYENIAKDINKAGSAITSVSMDVFLLPYNLSLSQDNKVYFNPQDFNIKHHNTINLVADVLIVLEEYSIVLPKFKIYPLAINVQLDKTRDAFNNVYQTMLDMMQIEHEKGDVIYLEGSTSVDERFRERTKVYREEMSTINDYLSDMIIDAQNILLEEIFDRKVNIRSPIGDSYIAISSESEREQKIIDFLRRQAPDKEKFKEMLREYHLS